MSRPVVLSRNPVCMAPSSPRRVAHSPHRCRRLALSSLSTSSQSTSHWDTPLSALASRCTPRSRIVPCVARGELELKPGDEGLYSPAC
eukprot:CAMPEP_0181390110 /NCGR_PEP_ID=MMETSP1106-20121128/25301_1 /TAXON_ID=81844 /ORGANISM="Mantoniella antarctica, Strain SL-175" /LENGTH=87 /DNA_ID=CAMNT_0023510981 /DNA_START=79 /DNA_END=339 /DNA_ORIENTATION=-